ncbi:prolyl oligopeptidase family serine peptidase, partial [bacterium]|nr:prolyl oligopeptidase family serine peptidase [bacterium]
LIRVHGGPAGDVEATRDGAIRHAHLLRSGYRILEPAFRGSLGFGDDFLGANIGCQGTKDLDDIVKGVDNLVEAGIADIARVGKFGGSYGGYLTLRAVAITDRFKTGVALYGFIDNRRMTLETGDFTYEEEYIAPVTWPMDPNAVKSDVFLHLHEINCPLLLLHGDQDPICTLSQSKIVYRTLQHRGIPAGLVVYPGEGHGFRNPLNQKDCARRTLTWFEEFLPV